MDERRINPDRALTNMVDFRLWKQAKNLMTGIKKPSVLPNRVGAMVGLEEDPGEITPVTLVDGAMVKVKHDMDFAESCSEEECPDYCEGIWIDANQPIREWPFLLYREAHKYRDMCQDKLSCEVADERARKGERELRMNDLENQGKAI